VDGASLRRESATKATASEPWSTIRRVDSCITWPGTVYSLSFTFTPARVLKKTGIMSKKSVRSSLVSSVMSRPRTFPSIFWNSAWRLVVFPERAGP